MASNAPRASAKQWHYPLDVLHLLPPFLPRPTLAVLVRVNTLFNTTFTPALYRTMHINDMYHGLRLRRALQLPAATEHTRVLHIDSQHSCDECFFAGSPNLPNLQRVVLSFDRGAYLSNPAAAVWPEDPCRTLSRARPGVLVVRTRNHFADAVLPALREHMIEAVIMEAEQIVCVTSTTHYYDLQTRANPLDTVVLDSGHVTQIFLPPPPSLVPYCSSTPACDEQDPEVPVKQAVHWGFWTRVSRLADYIALHPPSVKWTIVGLEYFGMPPSRLEERPARELVKSIGMIEDAPFGPVQEKTEKTQVLVRRTEVGGEEERGEGLGDEGTEDGGEAWERAERGKVPIDKMADEESVVTTFRRRVAARVRFTQRREDHMEKESAQVERAVQDRLDVLEFIPLAAYLRIAGESEIPSGVGEWLAGRGRL